MKLKILISLVAVILAIIILGVVDFLIIKNSGSPVYAPEIPRGAQKLGSGPTLTYVVMGDSTAIGQGTEYSQSYARESAEYLAKNHSVTLVNTGISGARAADLPRTQLAKAESYQPDVVLVAVGANDVTHLTRDGTVKQAMQTVIDGLKKSNPTVKIILTGSPAMGSVPRLPWPLRQIAGLRANHLNNHIFKPLVAANHLTFAPVAEKTGAAFAADPTLFAPDKFHPDARGYALWTPVIDAALDQALAK